MERARYCSTSTLASTSASESASCYRQIIKYIAHLWRRNKRRFLRRYRAYRSRKRLERIEELKRRRAAAAAANISLNKRPLRDSAVVEAGGVISNSDDHPTRRRRRRQQQRKRRKRSTGNTRRRRYNPQCPKHGGQQQQQPLPSVSSQVALRLNDGRVSPPELASTQLATTPSSIQLMFLGTGDQPTVNAAIALSPVQPQRSSPFLSPRGTVRVNAFPRFVNPVKARCTLCPLCRFAGSGRFVRFVTTTSDASTDASSTS